MRFSFSSPGDLQGMHNHFLAGFGNSAGQLVAWPLFGRCALAHRHAGVLYTIPRASLSGIKDMQLGAD